MRIFVDNQEIAVTNERGEAFINRLLSYQPNIVSIIPEDLPIGVDIFNSQITVVPYARSGIRIEFPIHSARNALIVLQLLNGDFAPAGSRIRNLKSDLLYTVAERGEVYLEDLLIGDNAFEAKYDNKTCTFTVRYEETDDPLPHLGTIICQEKTNEMQP